MLYKCEASKCRCVTQTAVRTTALIAVHHFDGQGRKMSLVIFYYTSFSLKSLYGGESKTYLIAYHFFLNNQYKKQSRQ